MPDSKINVTSGGGGLGLFLFLSAWLVFGRGCDNTPSSFEYWLDARYEYRAEGADWPAPPQGEGEPPDRDGESLPE